MVSVVIFSRDDILELLDRWKEPSNLSIRPAVRKENYRLFIGTGTRASSFRATKKHAQ